jgi:hypothetical protein
VERVDASPPAPALVTALYQGLDFFVVLPQLLLEVRSALPPPIAEPKSSTVSRELAVILACVADELMTVHEAISNWASPERDVPSAEALELLADGRFHGFSDDGPWLNLATTRRGHHVLLTLTRPADTSTCRSR